MGSDAKALFRVLFCCPKEELVKIDKKNITLIIGVIAVCGLWWMLSPGGGSPDKPGMASLDVRMKQIRESNERARETHCEIGASVRELENRSQRIESGVGEIEDAANGARAILERDRDSLAKGREVIRAVEERRAKATSKPGA